MNMKFAPLVLTLAVCVACSTTEAQYRGASGNTYTGGYLGLSASQRADVARYQNASRIIVTTRDVEDSPAWPQSSGGASIIRTSQREASEPYVGPIPTTFERPTAAPSNPQYQPPQPRAVTVSQTTPSKPTIQELAGKASTNFERTEESFRQNIDDFKTKLMDELSRHEAAPTLNPLDESRRLEIFKKMLQRTVEMGRIVKGKKETLRAGFENWKRAAIDAAPTFRQAEQFLRSKADEEGVKSAKDIYITTADWYAARAARAELRAKSDIPPTFDEAMKRLDSNVRACELLLSFLEDDPYNPMTQSQSDKNLGDFTHAFKSIAEILDAWQKILIRDLKPPDEKGQPKKAA